MIEPDHMELSVRRQCRSIRRAGIEWTISEGIRSHGPRRMRYIGEAITHLQHVAAATAMNTVRLCHWLMEKERARTRRSAYERRMPPPAPN